MNVPNFGTKKENIMKTYLKKGVKRMDAKQIRDYTALVRRRAEIVLCFGKSWTQELHDELKKIDEELQKYENDMTRMRQKAAENEFMNIPEGIDEELPF